MTISLKQVKSLKILLKPLTIYLSADKKVTMSILFNSPNGKFIHGLNRLKNLLHLSMT